MPKLSLSDCQKGGSGLPPRLVIQGRPAIGKTITTANAPNPIFFLSPGETGLRSLIDSGQLPADFPNIEIPHWQNLLELIEELRAKKHGRKTLVLDVADGFEKLANIYVCEKDYGGDMSGKGFMNYHIGYRTVAMGEWKMMLAALDRLRSERRMQIILLAHTGVSNHKNPLGDDYGRWTPAFDGKPAWELTFAWADVVLFADYEVATIKDPNKKDAKAKARGGDKRWFYTNWQPGFDAKNRYGLDDMISMGNSGAEAWANFMSAMPTINIEKEGE